MFRILAPPGVRCKNLPPGEMPQLCEPLALGQVWFEIISRASPDYSLAAGRKPPVVVNVGRSGR